MEKAHRLSEEDRHEKKKLVSFRTLDIDLIDRAARYAGMPTAVFIRNAALLAARKVLAEGE